MALITSDCAPSRREIRGRVGGRDDQALGPWDALDGELRPEYERLPVLPRELATESPAAPPATAPPGYTATADEITVKSQPSN